MRRLIFALTLLLAAMPSVRGQTFDASQWTQGTITIDAPWRFHPGDDPLWASPNFDDSSWPLLQTARLWNYQGYRGYHGYAWYRLRLKLPATTQPLGINIGHINSAAEVYADGQLIGTNGIMRPKPDWSAQLIANAFPLPVDLNGRWVEIAVRVWKSPVASSYSGGGFIQHPVVGSLALLQDSRRIAIDNDLAASASSLILDLLMLVLGCGALGLFLLDRRNKEYAWFAIWTIGAAVLDLLLVPVNVRQGSVTLARGYAELFELPIYFCELLFFWGFLRARRGGIFFAAVFFDIVGAVCNLLGYLNILSLPVGQAILTGCYTVVFVLVIARVALSLKAGSRDAWLLIVPMCLFAAGNVVDEVRRFLFFAGLSHAHFEQPLNLWTNGIVSIDATGVFQILNLVAISFAILLRFTRSAQEEKRLATELAAAREVQTRFVPTQLPALGSLRLEAAYLPAAEVGGDFYQVLPLAGGATLIVIGDVSGKGLKAAMLATLVVGALHSLTQQNLPPAEILSRLNRQLVDSSDGGFVTCLCARIDADGACTLANAGHLAPYRNGDETSLDSGLPLGIAPDVTYAESTIRLAPDDRLTFLSDGVVEAQSESGELFGFDRTRQISSRSAEEIARAAQAHGQQDDITVLTLTFAPAEVLHA